MDFPHLSGTVGISRFIDYCNSIQDKFNQVNTLISNPGKSDDPNWIGNYAGNHTTEVISYPAGAVKHFINQLPDGWKPLNCNVFIKVGNPDLTIRGNTNKSHTHSSVGITYSKSAGNYSQGDTDPVAVESTTDDYSFTWISSDSIQVNLSAQCDSAGGVAYPKHITMITGVKT